ncbi:hypothetical protein [Dickeya sp. NCPPB 3274]|uniref:hypothetical protein n=1 Tax=Dickeya sp. NCPPB 3274 TaxID=568766 RepID=UPI0003A67DED|nr:hypothetical protein [Dickeya sp. NCPPB 3274]
MKNNSAISRIEKIIYRIKDGAFNDSDVELFFVTLRELKNATRNIVEIGSFVAHNHCRDKGLISDYILRNYLFLSVRVGMDNFLANSSRGEFPKYFPVLIKLQLKMFDNAHFKKKFGLKGGEINRIRYCLNDKGSYLIDGDVCRLNRNVGKKELLIINEVLSLLNCSDGINFDDLIIEIKKLLSSEIKGFDVKIIDEEKLSIFCVIVCLLNNVSFLLLNDVRAETIISIERDQTVGVCVKYSLMVPGVEGDTVQMINPVFYSRYDKKDVFNHDITMGDIESGNLQFSKSHGRIVKINSEMTIV